MKHLHAVPKKRLLTSALLLALAPPLAAQVVEAPRETTQAETASDATELDAVMVTGIRGSLTSSMNLKRDAQGIVDGIVADCGFTSPEEIIRAVLEVHDKDKARREEKLDSLLAEFSIAHLRKSPAVALSGGERRRLEIARALATDPTFMLLDEPFAGVDPISVADIQALVRHLTSRGIGVLITDHNVRETLGLIDRAYIIHAGEVLTHGRPDAIVTNPDVRRLYLGEAFSL